MEEWLIRRKRSIYLKRHIVPQLQFESLSSL